MGAEMRMDVDFLVVGAGAAGCTLGWLLRQAGADVLVLELRDARRLDKLCGGILGMGGLAELRGIFGEGALEGLGLTYPPRLRRRFFAGEKVAGIRFPTVERRRLDGWLRERYAASGGALRDRVRLVGIDEAARVATCTDLRTGGCLEVSFGALVGADGASSKVRRLLTGRRQAVVPSLEGTVPPAGEDIVFEYRLARQGYCWYIPTGPVANVGCVLYDGGARDCREWIASFCREMGVATPELRGAAIPTGDDVLLRAGGRVWLAGDAAGLVSPIDGGGIGFALASSRLLASALLGGPSYEEALRPLVERLGTMAAKRSEAYLLASMRGILGA